MAPFVALVGEFYQFYRARNIARPGAVIDSRVGIEIGPLISREEALRRVRAGSGPQGKPGKDVYTVRRRDAERLALDAYRAKPVEETHQPSDSEDMYFSHFHPGGRFDERGPTKKPDTFSTASVGRCHLATDKRRTNAMDSEPFSIRLQSSLLLRTRGIEQFRLCRTVSARPPLSLLRDSQPLRGSPRAARCTPFGRPNADLRAVPRRRVSPGAMRQGMTIARPLVTPSDRAARRRNSGTRPMPNWRHMP